MEFSEKAKKILDLEGRILERVEINALGIIFHFGSKNGDSGVAYWAYGNPKKSSEVRNKLPPEDPRLRRPYRSGM